MKVSNAILIWAVLFCTWGLPLELYGQDLRQKAEAEGSVVFYASFNANDSKALADGFKQAYPKIDATFYRTTDSQLMERILTESRAGRNLWDVVIATNFYGHALKKRNMLAAYDSPERKFYRDGYKDAQATWTSTYTNYAAFGYNTHALPKSGVPKAYSDLLKSEWTGQIGLEARAYEWFGTMINAMGQEKGLAYMRQLAKQVVLRNGRTLIAQLVAAGEFAGAVASYSQTFEVLKPGGAPVDWVYLNPVYANIHPTGIASKAPHPNAARLFMNFALSKRGQEIIRDVNRIPDRIDVLPLQPRLVQGIKPVFAPTDVIENFERYAKMFGDIFGGR
jgi:iron(III) transport system substrate-binding protein